MKQILASLLALSAVATQASADVVLFEDFEDATVTYTTSEPEYSDGTGDFFTRTDGSNIGGFYEISGVQGSSYFAAMDLDGDGTNPASLTFTVDITGYENLSFSALFAEDDDGNDQDWDNSDGFTITGSIDAGATFDLFAIVEGGTDGSNEAPFIDTDFNGTPDGAEITDTLTEYGNSIPGTGTTLEIVLTYTFNAGDEDLAIDNFTIMGDLTTAAIPEPTAALFGSLLAGALGMTVARRPNSRD